MLQRAPVPLAGLLASRADPPITGAPFEWLDAGLRLRPPERRGPFSLEWRGVEFIVDEDPGVGSVYDEFWPRIGNRPGWDAVGVRRGGAGAEWLLVEAKAHIGELRHSCAARTTAEGGQRESIEARLMQVRDAVGASGARSWLAPYFRFANRIATLWFLYEQGIDARLVYVCLVGEERRADVARSTDEWQRALAEMDGWLGRPFAHPLEERIHAVVLPLADLDPRAPAQ
jgi:hypothetical protein